MSRDLPLAGQRTATASCCLSCPSTSSVFSLCLLRVSHQKKFLSTLRVNTGDSLVLWGLFIQLDLQLSITSFTLTLIGRPAVTHVRAHTHTLSTGFFRSETWHWYLLAPEIPKTLCFKLN